MYVGNLFGPKKIRSEFFLGQQNLGQKKFGSKKFGVQFFLHESSSWVKIGLHAENQLPGWSGSGLKVCVVGGGWWVGGGWVLTHNLVKPTLLVKVELGFDNLYLFARS